MQKGAGGVANLLTLPVGRVDAGGVSLSPHGTRLAVNSNSGFYILPLPVHLSINLIAFGLLLALILPLRKKETAY